MAKLVHDVQKRQHRERSQVTSRARLGFLEKHKDYVKRAQDYHKKQNTLKVLKTRAKERNPDEFYYGMNSRKVDSKGLLITSRRGEDEDESLSMDQVKLLKSQDSNYVRTMRQQELNQLKKKTNKLMFQASGKHTVFTENREERDNFDAAEFFDTTDDMLNRRENRLTKDQLTMSLTKASLDAVDSIMPKESLDKKKVKKFKIVKQHIERENKLKEVQRRMDMQREVMKNGSKKKIVDKKGNVSFKWKKQRKR
ncbi:similar to Saccharomyces cerevisiae YKL099C UTP11 Subunit of U3-containing Small Subunit (SSU) processome complex involved in production of 18S rRNA and assembly of small ribosomal subunit [Maudiozyma barnettii]|uniref:U3 small nucleolar RNA-associated protein 11 n=1 Tax=Maudiozyma barnettii TaxID=61262 RepID=A0A8H2ZMJ5_9SACH|nr:rRNA-processing protein UTP11 [Kazachstania barnettii]CAB4257152.1 similar to Saccharomyces cerevisiae YKL099C UTP11 Subunit of U3-containing Small Subunit (SSU) processome complex involved in production of 18S rRNA and assembly of small ribosomal subunit [Kazachstania barnettii]CAD1779522.1 similar to Saccharomyces cerevisiae YKL099C UTP11 Subunit of U3-containing Small Subunit (SSU) processome complex involved in production of 18S rRNA and assembly of small ribosomal subunit [Kazachstania ba